MFSLNPVSQFGLTLNTQSGKSQKVHDWGRVKDICGDRFQGAMYQTEVRLQRFSDLTDFCLNSSAPLLCDTSFDGDKLGEIHERKVRRIKICKRGILFIGKW